MVGFMLKVKPIYYQKEIVQEEYIDHSLHNKMKCDINYYYVHLKEDDLDWDISSLISCLPLASQKDIVHTFNMTLQKSGLSSVSIIKKKMFFP